MKLEWTLIFLCAACTVTSIQKENKAQELVTTETEISPGKVKFFEFSAPLPNGKQDLKCGKDSLAIYVQNYKAKVYLAESYFSKRKTYKCFTSANPKKALIVVKVVPFKYPSEKLNVDKKRIDLSKKDLKRVIAENEIKKEIYKESADEFLFQKPFSVPLNSYITSHYGTRRIFNNKKEGQHLGNDLRAAVGVPIPVANDGKVVFAGDLFFSGNVVVVDHGLGIYTMYGHLSKVQVKKGDLLSQGHIVGLAGKTGRVSGPHLHWGVRVNGHWVDGFSLATESKKLASK